MTHLKTANTDHRKTPRVDYTYVALYDHFNMQDLYFDCIPFKYIQFSTSG